MKSACTLALLALSISLPALAQRETAPGVEAFPREIPESIRIGETPLEVIPDSDAPVITLEELLERAVLPEGNLDIVVLREQFEQANIAVQRAWSVLLPLVTAAGTYTLNAHEAIIRFPNFEAGFTTLPDGRIVPADFLPPIPLQKKHQLGAVGQVSVPILLMPAYYGISAANLGVEASQQSVTFARNELILGISQSYYGAVASRRLIEVAYQQVQAQREQERVSQARFEVGEVPKVDVLRAAVARSQAEQDLVRAKNSFVSTKLALQKLTGIQERFDVVSPRPAEAPSGTVDELVRTGLEKRQDLNASRTQVEIADRLVKSAWWQFAPVISAQGQLLWSNVSGFTGNQLNWNLQLVASVNLFDGFLRYANIQDARSRRRQAEANRSNLGREVIRDVKTSLLDLESSKANLLTATDRAQLAAENADLVRAQYDAGVATYLDVTDALSARFAAEIAVVTEELNVQVASLRLSRAIGTFGVAQFP